MDSKNTSLRTYSTKERNMYLLGMAGQNILYNVIGASLAYYLQFTIFIPAIAVSTIMALARVWDAFNDPIMGTIVDKTRTKWGKCRPYLLFAPAPIFVITMACFLNFGFYDGTAGASGKNVLIVAWAAVTYILWGMCYTVGDIPLWGITPLMTEVDRDRTKLLSYCRIAASIGAGITLFAIQPLSLALGELFAKKLGDNARGERMGFIVGAFIFTLIGTVLFQMAGIFTKEKIPPSQKSYTLKENFTLMWKNKPFRQILLSGILGSPKQLVLLGAMPLITYYYASKEPLMAMVYMVLLGGANFIGQFAAMALSPVLTKIADKKTLYNGANLICVIPYLVLFILYVSAPTKMVEPVYLAVTFLFLLISGVGVGITNVFQSLMIADAVDYQEYVSGVRTDGVFFSGQSFITKLASGIATLISGVGYTIVGFSDAKVQEVNEFISAGGIPRLEPKYASYLMILFFLITIPPAIGSLLSVIPTWKYALPDKEHERILNELNEKRHKAEESPLGESTLPEENL